MKTRLIRLTTRIAAIIISVYSIVPEANAGFRTLHHFVRGAPSSPFGLTLNDDTLYVTTSASLSRGGSLVKVDIDGSNFSVIHTFENPREEGLPPTVAGASLLGVTTGTTGFGGDDRGVLYKVNDDGSNFEVLHVFAPGITPHSSLTQRGSELYGVSFTGGVGGQGTVFKINVDGTGFKLLHQFVSGENDGGNPATELTLSGSTLYGTTVMGGDRRSGTIFKVDVDGTGFELLHEFADPPYEDNVGLFTPLTLVGSSLYGMTYRGGDKDLGTIFKIETDGTGFQVLHHFIGGASDGSNPFGELELVGSTLYGSTRSGNGSGMYDVNVGTLFAINTDGTGYRILFEFNGANGSGPTGMLTRRGPTLFGVTLGGGAANAGTVFAIEIPEPSSFAVAATGLIISASISRRLKRVSHSSIRI